MKKKIIFIIESFIVGGAEKMLIDIVNHLDPDLYDITVCSIYKYSVYPNYERYYLSSTYKCNFLGADNKQ